MRVLFLLLLAIPSISYCQEIKIDEVDKFTKQRRIETTVATAKMTLGCFIGFYYRSVDSTLFINVRGGGCAVGVVGTNDPFIFLLDNDSTVTVYSKGIQDYEISYNKTTGTNKYYTHEYYIKKSDIEKLAAHKLVSIRAYINQGYSDLDLKSKRQDDLMKLSAMFLKAISK